jgi:hypothetical protein
MSLDLEMFLKDAFEKALKENPDYANMKIKDMIINIESGKVTFAEVEVR